MEEKAVLPPPYYDPDVVARAIMQCAQTSHRDVTVANMAGFAVIQLEHLFPRTLDRIMEKKVFDLQKRGMNKRLIKMAFMQHRQKRAGSEVIMTGLFYSITCLPIYA